jgi:hypothetical protein
MDLLTGSILNNTLTEEHRIRVFENRILRRVLATKEMRMGNAQGFTS